MELIDKDALVAEIERRRDESWLGMYTKEKGIIFDITDDILSFINTFEVKEVDSTDAFIDKATEWLEENLAKETSVIGNGNVTINFRGAIEAFKKAMEE